jgi:hypothetical protein
MTSVSHRGAWSPAGSVRQVAQFLGICRNACEQTELILQAALDPAMAHRARRGEFVTCLDHFDLLQTARHWAIWGCQVLGPLVKEDLRCCHTRHREVTHSALPPGQRRSGAISRSRRSRTAALAVGLAQRSGLALSLGRCPTSRIPQYTLSSSRGRRCWPPRPQTRDCCWHSRPPSARSQRDAGCFLSSPLAH